MIENLPFSALRVFECAARHLSFKHAAEELCVTPAAVSLQIKMLEDHLGLKLFHRHNRGLTLTEQATNGLPVLSKGFENIVDSVKLMRNPSEKGELTVWMAPAFATKWLMPRLHRFSQSYPDIDLDITASTRLIDSNASKSTISAENFYRDGVDIAIRFGKGDYPGCQIDKLFPVSAIPLCSPKLLKGKHPLKHPEDLRYHTLLHDNTRYEGRPDWATWLQAAEVEDVDSRHGIHFNHVNLALAAAIDGQGVVLSMAALASDDIKSGRLVVPFDISLPLLQAYYAITLKEYADQPRVKAFREWLIDEASKQEQ